MSICPHCGGTGQLADADPMGELRAACRAAGIIVSPHDDVNEDDAARLMTIEPKTLKNWRYGLDPRTPPSTMRNGRHRYDLTAIAAYLDRK